MGRIYGFRQGHNALLHMPAQDHLPHILVILLRQGCEHRVCEQFPVPVAQRIPGFGDDTVLPHKLPQFLLLEQGVALHLVHRRQGLHLGQEFSQQLRRHVADADRTDLARLFGLFQCPPGACHIAVGLVEQVKVQIIRTQILQGRFDPLLCRFIAVVLQPELTGEENLFPGNAAVFDGFAHVALI